MGRRPPIDLVAGICHEGISGGADGRVDGNENMGVGDGVDADADDEYDAEECVIDDRTLGLLLPELGVLLDPDVIRVGCAIPVTHLDCSCC